MPCRAPDDLQCIKHTHSHPCSGELACIRGSALAWYFCECRELFSAGVGGVAGSEEGAVWIVSGCGVCVGGVWLVGGGRGASRRWTVSGRWQMVEGVLFVRLREGVR